MRKIRNVKTWPVFILFVFFHFPVGAVDRPNILIMGEDADEDSVPRDSQIFARVLNGLSNQLHDVGFDVFDETAVTLENFAQGRVRRTDSELIDIARSIRRPPIDVVVLFSIYSTAYKNAYTTKAHARIQGRLLNVHTGQRLGNVELDYPDGWNAPADCDRDCLLSTVGDHSKLIANDVGLVLAQKLSWLVKSQEGGEQSITAFNLVFDDFTQDQVLEFEEYLVIFSGYISHRIVYAGATRTEYWYKSSAPGVMLNRNLNRLLEALNIRSLIQVSGNTYTVKNISLRHSFSTPDPRDW